MKCLIGQAQVGRLEMPVRRVKGGYRWGSTGKTYPTKEQAERQGRAIRASGYKPKRSK